MDRLNIIVRFKDVTDMTGLRSAIEELRKIASSKDEITIDVVLPSGIH